MENQEGKSSRKEVIKNIAIIFLSIMLLLTLFSNTIMNYSLPQVSTVYATNGNVSEQVKGSGTVEYAQKFEVKLDTTREIEAVHVKKGDKVTAGDKLFTLKKPKTEELELEDYRDDAGVISAKSAIETAESNLDNARVELTDAQFDLRKALDPTAADDHDYSIDNKEIADAKQELARLEEKLAIVKSGKDPLTVTTEEYNKVKAEYEDKKRDKERYDEMFKAVDTDDNIGLTDTAYNRLLAAKQRVEKAEKTVKDAEEKAKEVSEKNTDAAKSKDSDIEAKRSQIRQYRADIDTYYVKINNIPMTNIEDLTEYNKNIEGYQNSIAEIEAKITVLQGEINDLQVKNALSKDAKDRIDSANKKVKDANKELADAKAALAEMKREFKVTIRKKVVEVDNELYELNKKVTEAENKKNAAKEAGGQTASEIEKDITAQKKTIADLEKALQKTQKTDSQTDKKNERDNANTILEKQRAVEKAEAKIGRMETALGKARADYDTAVTRAKEKIQKKIDKAKKNEAETEVLAKISGVVDSLNVTEGSQAEANSVLALINVVDLGLILEMPCKAEQARKVKVGDRAEITSWYFGEDFEAVVKEIKSDKNNPQTQKVIVFSIKGTDIEPGQTLSLSLGSKGQSYSSVIPNNALRSDGNGKYVLVLESKATPLGNRYTAVRTDVSVIVQDDTKTAVSGLSGSEFIITTSSKPIDAGAQVRLADSN